MPRRGPSEAQIAAMRVESDVAGLVEAYESTKRRDRRRAILAALAKLGDNSRTTLLHLLGDGRWQRGAGAVLVELGEETFLAVAEQLESDEGTRRRGALHTVYLYARYRDLPAAHELLRAVAAGKGAPDLAEPADRMSDTVERLTRARNEKIDENLERIRASVDREKIDRGGVVSRMYSTVHSRRMEARAAIVGLRHAGVRHVIAVAPEFGEAAVGVLLALGLTELGGGVVPPIAESLRSGDRRRRGLLLTTLICLRHARVPGAAEALERDGATITEAMDRRAATLYKRWVRER
jgi:hypothetical protein